MDWTHLCTQPCRVMVGLMSGTSCDGVDAAVVRVEGTGGDLRAQLLHFRTLPYPEAFRERLLAPVLDAASMCSLNMELGEWLARAVLDAVDAARCLGVSADAVASHGHTVWHQPPGAPLPPDHCPGTLQIGEPAVIAERTGLPVVSGFRTRDMAAGGQGAPLVPYADWALFRGHRPRVACLNIGGIANVTAVADRIEDVLAFDTGPGNMLIDGAARLVSGGRLAMDAGGAMAARGAVSPELLDEMLGHPYFLRQPPKSTGREEFGPGAYLDPLRRNRADIPPDDLLATVTRAVARSIGDALRAHVLPLGAEVVAVSGGGAHNGTLMRWIGDELPGVGVCPSDDLGWPADAREAVAFAILGSETLAGTPANVPGATGASRRVVLGSVTPA
jgi:anhydro-N-acetylmuramic acid kinase